MLGEAGMEIKKSSFWDPGRGWEDGRDRNCFFPKLQCHGKMGGTT
jgi:hypothetical protein